MKNAKTINDLYTGAKVYDPARPDVLFRLWAKDFEGGIYVMADNVLRQMCFDAAEEGHPYGNNDYALSNIRQYLNAEGADWYQPQHANDAAPAKANIYDGDNPYAEQPGFLAGFSGGFLAAILTANVESRDYKGNLRTLADRVFLPSATEMGFPTRDGMAEGRKLPLADNPRMRIAAPTAAAVETADWKPDVFATDRPWRWWLRSPHSGSSGSVRRVTSDGSEAGNYAYGGLVGLRPALVLKSDIFVSDAPDNGCAHRLLF